MLAAPAYGALLLALATRRGPEATFGPLASGLAAMGLGVALALGPSIVATAAGIAVAALGETVVGTILGARIARMGSVRTAPLAVRTWLVASRLFSEAGGWGVERAGAFVGVIACAIGVAVALGTRRQLNRLFAFGAFGSGHERPRASP